MDEKSLWKSVKSSFSVKKKIKVYKNSFPLFFGNIVDYNADNVECF